jgi:hypothetical protein
MASEQRSAIKESSKPASAGSSSNQQSPTGTQLNFSLD